MCQALGLRLGYQMVNVLLSRKVESNNLESNNVARWQKKTKKKHNNKHTELPVFVKILEIQ